MDSRGNEQLQMRSCNLTFLSNYNLVPRASLPLTSGRKTRALGASISGMRHRYHTCRLRMQNSVNSIVIWKWILPELSFSDRWSRGTKLWERDWSNYKSNFYSCSMELNKKGQTTRGLNMFTHYLHYLQLHTELHYVIINRSVYGASTERFRRVAISTALPPKFEKTLDTMSIVNQIWDKKDALV